MTGMSEAKSATPWASASVRERLSLGAVAGSWANWNEEVVGCEVVLRAMNRIVVNKSKNPTALTTMTFAFVEIMPQYFASQALPSFHRRSQSQGAAKRD